MTLLFVKTHIFFAFLCRFGTFGAVIEYGVDRKITEQSTLAATVAVGIPQGVILRIRLNRATQTYLFPLHLSDEVIMHCIAYFHAFFKDINYIIFTKK